MPIWLNSIRQPDSFIFQIFIHKILAQLRLGLRLGPAEKPAPGSLVWNPKRPIIWSLVWAETGPSLIYRLSNVAAEHTRTIVVWVCSFIGILPTAWCQFLRIACSWWIGLNFSFKFSNYWRIHCHVSQVWPGIVLEDWRNSLDGWRKIRWPRVLRPNPWACVHQCFLFPFMALEIWVQNAWGMNGLFIRVQKWNSLGIRAHASVPLKGQVAMADICDALVGPYRSVHTWRRDDNFWWLQVAPVKPGIGFLLWKVRLVSRHGFFLSNSCWLRVTKFCHFSLEFCVRILRHFVCFDSISLPQNFIIAISESLTFGRMLREIFDSRRNSVVFFCRWVGITFCGGFLEPNVRLILL